MYKRHVHDNVVVVAHAADTSAGSRTWGAQSSASALHAAAVMARTIRRNENGSCLLVAAAQNLADWKLSFNTQTTGDPVRVYHGGSAGDRQRMLHQLRVHGGVCLTTYGMLPKLGGALHGGGWQLVVLDQLQGLLSGGQRWRQLQCLGQLHFVVGIWTDEDEPEIDRLESRWPQYECLMVNS